MAFVVWDRIKNPLAKTQRLSAPGRLRMYDINEKLLPCHRLGPLFRVIRCWEGLMGGSTVYVRTCRCMHKPFPSALIFY